MIAGFVQTSVLEIQIKGLQRRIESFESGSAYQRLKDELRSANRTNEQLLEEIERLKKQMVESTKRWMEVNEDVEEEKRKELEKKDKEIEKLKEKIKEKDEKIAKLKAEKQSALEAKYKAEVELQDTKDKLEGLKAKYNKDSSNSSYTTAQKRAKKSPPNSREKTGRKPGAQPGHDVHQCEFKEPTFIHKLPTPSEFLDTNRYIPTGNVIRKQLVSAKILVTVTEFCADEYKDIETGQTHHAPFPFGLTNNVTYDPSVKALAYMLNNYCNVSIGNTQKFLSEASDGILNISTGFIWKMGKVFAELSKPEQDEAWNALASSPVFHIDYTFGRCNGSNTTIAIVCNPEGVVVYEPKPAKGHIGVKGTPAEVNTAGTCVSDHEAAFLKLGSRHQECLSHVGRDCKGSMDNEPNLKWNVQMKHVAYDIIRYRHGMKPGEDFDPVIVQDLEDRFYEAIKQGKKDYEDNPPSPYYREGYNLWKRMYKKPEEYLLTLHDITVPPTNNDAERYGRKFKRKQKQVMTFRSTAGHTYFCRGLTAMNMLRKRSGGLLNNISDVFSRGQNNGESDVSPSIR